MLCPVPTQGRITEGFILYPVPTQDEDLYPDVLPRIGLCFPGYPEIVTEGPDAL